MLLSDTRYVRDAVLDRARLGSQPGGALCGCEAPVSADDHAASLDRRLASENGCTPAKSFKPAVWGRLYGSHSRFDGDGVASVDRNLYGFVVGTDAEVSSHWRVGIAGGASRTLLNADQNQSAKVNGETIALYASGRYDAWNVRGGLAQSWYRVHSERNPSFGGFSDHDTASYDANATQVFTEIGYSTAIRNVALEPFVGLAYASLHTGSFRRTVARQHCRAIPAPPASASRRSACGPRPMSRSRRRARSPRSGPSAGGCVRQYAAGFDAGVRERRFTVQRGRRAGRARCRGARGRCRCGRHEEPVAGVVV